MKSGLPTKQCQKDPFPPLSGQTNKTNGTPLVSFARESAGANCTGLSAIEKGIRSSCFMASTVDEHIIVPGAESSPIRTQLRQIETVALEETCKEC